MIIGIAIIFNIIVILLREDNFRCFGIPAHVVTKGTKTHRLTCRQDSPDIIRSLIDDIDDIAAGVGAVDVYKSIARAGFNQPFACVIEKSLNGASRSCLPAFAIISAIVHRRLFFMHRLTPFSIFFSSAEGAPVTLPRRRG